MVESIFCLIFVPMNQSRTIQELELKIKTHPLDYERFSAIRELELRGEWAKAEMWWRYWGRTEDANACKLIRESNELGDRYRAETAHLIEWVDNTVEAGIMSKDEAIKQIYPELNRIHNQIY